MFEDKEIKRSLKEEKRREKAGKYTTLPRNSETERDLQRIFDSGTESDLTKYLREHGLPDGSAMSLKIVDLFREHAEKRRR
jgi:hypothetical protein